MGPALAFPASFREKIRCKIRTVREYIRLFVISIRWVIVSIKMNKRDAEYSAQLFHLAPSAITDITFGTMEVEIENVTETALGCMKSHHSDLGNEMDQGYVLLKARTEQETKSKEKKLEEYFLNQLRIPDQVLLPEDLLQRSKYKEKDLTKITREIEQYKLEIENSKYMEAWLDGKIDEGLETVAAWKAFISYTKSTLDCHKGLPEAVRLTHENVKVFQKQVKKCVSMADPSDVRISEIDADFAIRTKLV